MKDFLLYAALGIGLIVSSARAGLPYANNFENAEAGKLPDDAALTAGRQAAARAVLSVMPDYDRLAKELED